MTCPSAPERRNNIGCPRGGASDLYRELKERPAWVLSIIGAGGSGKTDKSFFVLDNWFPEEEVFLLNYPPSVIAKFPPHMRKRCHSFTSFEEISGKSGIVFFDDVALHFLSRSSGASGNKELIRMLTIARHNDWRFIITSQNSILNDKGLFEALDQFSLRCRMTLTQTFTEREEFQDVQLMVNNLIESRAGTHYTQTRPYAYCPETEELFRFPRWEHMTEDISKPYKGVYLDENSNIVFS